MRIALIQPPIEDFYSSPQRTYPLGLTYLAAACRDLPVDIEIIDLITSHGRYTLPVPDAFRSVISYFPYDRAPIAAFHTYYHYGASWKRIADHFKQNFYDICALSSNFYTYSEEVLKTAETIKSVSPASTVVVGGQNVGPYHDLFTSSPYIDHCIRGEAELSFRQWISVLLGDGTTTDHIPGIWDPGHNKWNPPVIAGTYCLSPDIGTLPVNAYRIAGKPAIMLSTSRGCPAGCRFCVVSRTFGSALRTKSVDQVLIEMQTAYDRGIRVFDIEDDNFSLKRSHCITLLDEIIRTFKGNIECYAMNGLSAEHLDEEIIDRLLKANFKLLNISLATVSVEHLQALHRHTDISHFVRIARYAGKMGLKTIGHYIAGLPGQSLSEVLASMRLLAELPLILGISPFYYIPGMDLSVPHVPVSCKEARLTRFFPVDDHLDERDLITLFRLSRWINYLKKQLLKKSLVSLAFNDIPSVFPDDLFLRSLVDNGKIIGVDRQNNLFDHNVSGTVIRSFRDLFRDTIIYCA
jgi:radical SAM superfamily enzyme YgiQ (UPF0313 family)